MNQPTHAAMAGRGPIARNLLVCAALALSAAAMPAMAQQMKNASSSALKEPAPTRAPEPAPVEAAPAAAAPADTTPADEGWQVIGTKRINERVDNDHLEVPGGERHDAIRICALDDSFELLELSVRFHNGDVQQFPRSDQVVEGGSCTDAFTFQGRNRNISKINLKYAKLRRGQLPMVVVQAR